VDLRHGGGPGPYLAPDGATLDYEVGLPPPDQPVTTPGRWVVVIEVASGAATWYRVPNAARTVQYLGNGQLLAAPYPGSAGQLLRTDLRHGTSQPISQLPARTMLPGDTRDRLPG
jgi:hypothetical protein